MECPDPRCVGAFNSTQDLQFHCHDIHCIPRVAAMERTWQDAKPEDKTRHKERSRRKKQHSPDSEDKVLSGTEVGPDFRGVIKYEFSHEPVEPLDLRPLTGNAQAAIRRKRSAPNIPSAGKRSRDISATPSSSSVNTSLITEWAMDETMTGTETPASSIGSDILEKIDPRLH